MNMPPILEDLLISCDFVSGESASRKMGISRTAVFKRIESLRRSGYKIEAVAGQGYRLVPQFDGLLPLEIKAKLQSQIFGKEVKVVQTLQTTQTELRAMADAGAPQGTVLVALRQTAGKGRLGHDWSSPKGGLWFSLLIRPSCPISEIYKLTLLFGVAVARSLRLYGVEALLKWPNDVMVRDKKISGILLESSAEPDRIEYVIAGIGINVNFTAKDLPIEYGAASTTILDELGKKIDRAELLSRILSFSEELYLRSMKDGFGTAIQEWKKLSCTIGRCVRVSCLDKEIVGTAVNLEPDGALLVSTKDGHTEKIYSGGLDFC